MGGIGERLTLGEGQLDLRHLLSQGAGLGDQALFICAVDIAWRKEQRNVGLGSASSSSGSAQLQLGDCFYLFVTITSVRVDSTRLQPTAPRGQQAANPGASPGTKICVVKRMEHPQRQVCECLRGRRCIPRIFCCRHGWLCSMRSLGWTQCLLQLFLAG